MSSEKKSAVRIYLKGKEAPVEMAVPYWSCVRLMAFFYLSKRADNNEEQMVNVLSLDTSVIGVDFDMIDFIAIDGDLCGSSKFIERVYELIKKQTLTSPEEFCILREGCIN